MTVAAFVQARRGLLFAAYTATLLALNIRALQAWLRLALNDSTASHLVVVPLVSGLLLYQRRRAIVDAARFDAPAGALTMLSGLALTLSSFWIRSTAATDQLAAPVAGVVLMWVGGFLTLFGGAAFRTARFPLLLLAFMIPIPTPLLDAVTNALKRGSAATVAALFTATGTPFYREGFTFSLPKFVIEIADECSGIRSSIALFFTTLIAGEMFLQSFWRRAVLVAISLPLAMLKNGVRIVSLSLLASYVDPGFLHGSLHHDGGIVFFLMALVMLTPVLAALSHSERTLTKER